ncbi:MAG: hypothetical protein O6913_09355 [Chloroflexi bacterium]|nr:hypothetical protein [Chloroflexota bacterium]
MSDETTSPEPDEQPQPSALLNHDAQERVEDFLLAVRGGRPWFEVLLETVEAWEVPVEVTEEREYRYLYGGEAFDWLVLAQRLCDAGADAGLIPRASVDALLLEEQLPERMEEEEFKERIGPAKYRAHLNFIYGVRLEEALQLSVELRIQKERGGGLLAHDRRWDPMNDVFSRIYGSDRDSLLHEFREASGRLQVNRISLTELTDFTYWLFKRRVTVQDPARVASDTRLAMLTLQSLQELKRARTGGGVVAGAEIKIVDTVAVPTR